MDISATSLLNLRAKGVPYLNYVLEQSEAIDLIEQSTLTWMASGVTDDEGNANFTNLPAGSYTIVAGVGSLEFIPLFFEDQHSIEQVSFFDLNSSNPSFSTHFSLDTGAVKKLRNQLLGIQTGS